MEDTPGHQESWNGIDDDHVQNVIPEFFLFLSVIFGGTYILNQDNDSQKYKQITSIAQDIIFGVSDNTKLTPKHIGLGLTLHQLQATTSENLINLFHSAGHTIGIDTVQTIDTSIANKILYQYQQNGNIYIPCDYIDVLE